MAPRLSEILPDLGEGVARTIKLCGLLECWEKVAGERVRKQTEAVKIRNRTLFVNTTSPAWAQELNFLKQEFIAKFNAAAGEDAINDIRFRSGG